VRKAVAVEVQTVQRRAVPLQLDAVGTVEAEHSVEVRAQVSGILARATFAEGQRVHAGALLFEIDPAPFKVAVDQVAAALARDRAQADNAQVQLDRMAPLIDKGYVTPGDYDQARATAAAAAATVAADEAALEKARIDLSYTQIRAPITGRTGNLAVKPGNLVNANAALVTINQTQPALVRFTVPQQQLDTVRRYQKDGQVTIEVRAEATDGPMLGKGQLVFIDNNVNPQTGTVLLKARVPNADEALWPGQFVNARMILAVEVDRVVIPESALQSGQQGPFVYVLDDGKARMQEITVDRQVGADIVVAAGLAGGEALIARFPRDLAPGAAVTPATPVAGKGARP
jgi:multidrug efflux system membrane fusion protein